ncbi:IS66 family transposase [Cohnella fermenti]|uniref:IS66 family transposase n=1 Tax=Cohnella fermenti TaxID=2565925 RepID=A0A4S4BXC0_9BACL|nr:IS66 family transposase [Cohnella fermenti]
MHKLTTCADCGHSLADATHKGVERRQEVDIPLPRTWTTEHRAETGCCAHCGRKQVAAFPPPIKAPTQYGLGFAAWTAYFHAYHMLPVSRMADLFEDLTTYRPSEATLLSFLQTSYEVLEPVETAIAKKLRRQEVVWCMRMRPGAAWTANSTGFTSAPTVATPTFACTASAAKRRLRRLGSCRSTKERSCTIA